MTSQTLTQRFRFRRSIVAGLIGIVTAAWAADAQAACFTSFARAAAQRSNDLAPSLRTATSQFADNQAAARPEERNSGASAVGLWHALFLLGDGPDKFDEAFQTIQTGGTEMMLSNGLPPSLGNVCVGVWKQEGRTVTLQHMAWNWTGEGGFAGTFVMAATFRVSRNGSTYEGRWSAQNFDPDGQLIPELNAEGVVRARRVTVD